MKQSKISHKEAVEKVWVATKNANLKSQMDAACAAFKSAMLNQSK